MGRFIWAMVTLVGASATCGEPGEPRCASACTTAQSCGLLPSRLGEDWGDCVSSCELIDDPDRGRDREEVLGIFGSIELSAPDVEICAELARELAARELGFFADGYVTVEIIDRDLYYEIVGDPSEDNRVSFCPRSDECGAVKTCDPRACERLQGTPPPGCEGFEGLEIEVGVRQKVPMGAMLVETSVSETFTCAVPRTYFPFIKPAFGTAFPYVRFRGGADGGPTFCYEEAGRFFEVGPGWSLALVPTPVPHLFLEAQETMASCDSE